MKSIENILNKFECIDLEKLNSLKLMDRRDIKFVFSYNELPALLEQMPVHYNILAIDGKFDFSYKTQYFDTHDFAMYLKHHNGALNRYKVRQRTYLESNSAFLEVKLKTNKGFTIKERIAHNYSNNDWTDAESNFITSKAPYVPASLGLKVTVNYKRITLVNKYTPEKVTIDLNLVVSNNESKYSAQNMVILEIKQASKIQSPVFSLLKDMHCKPFSLSKYCLGVNFLYPQVKKNNFKEKMVTLNKIINNGYTGPVTSL